MKLSTLYKRAVNGKVNEWTIEIKGHCYRTTSGYTDGVKTNTEWTCCEGKNVGRSNETTAEEQAMKEAKAEWDKRTERGYFVNIKDIDKGTIFKPMLANKWEDYVDKIKFPIFSQPKLDGCLSFDTLVTTDQGNIPIGEIVEKELDCKVLSYNTTTSKQEWKSILNRMKDGEDINEKYTQWYLVETESGSLKVTGNHRVYLPELRCWRRVDELEEGDKLLLTRPSNLG
jgi:hypothetical protein